MYTDRKVLRLVRHGLICRNMDIYVHEPILVRHGLICRNMLVYVHEPKGIDMETSWSEWIAEKSLGPWIAEHCEQDPTYKCKSSELYKAYTSGQREAVSMKSVALALRHLGFFSSRAGQGRIWIGLRLKDMI